MLYFHISAIIAVEAAHFIFSHGQTMPQRDVDQEKLEWQFWSQALRTKISQKTPCQLITIAVSKHPGPFHGTSKNEFSGSQFEKKPSPWTKKTTRFQKKTEMLNGKRVASITSKSVSFQTACCSWWTSFSSLIYTSYSGALQHGRREIAWDLRIGIPASRMGAKIGADRPGLLMSFVLSVSFCWGIG